MDLQPAVELCDHFEGFSSKPYLCPAGVPTIGKGTTFYPDGRRVTLEDPPITEDYADACLEYELERCLLSVMRMCPNLRDTNKINAIVDFVYNLGAGRLQTSTLRRKINEEDWDASQKELMRWVLGGGKVLKGLVLRRQAECLLMK
jgi:lysozyme